MTPAHPFPAYYLLPHYLFERNACAACYLYTVITLRRLRTSGYAALRSYTLFYAPDTPLPAVAVLVLVLLTYCLTTYHRRLCLTPTTLPAHARAAHS